MKPYADKYIDLHLHLDGAITVPIARKLASMQKIDLPISDPELKRMLSVPDGCANLNEFLTCFALPDSLLQTEESLSEAVCLVCEEARNAGVVYAEIRFAPQLHCQKGMNQRQAVEAALNGLKRTKLKANLILCCMRGDGNEKENAETVQIAQQYLVEDGGVTALDLAGAEALFATSQYRELFADAKTRGIPFTIHAGEADGPESIRLAVEYGASRIGHGVRIREDERVLQMVKEKGITLEMCPTSNQQTCAVTNMAEYPLREYLHRGLSVTLNTDDPAIEGITLENEYRYMENLLGLTAQEEQQLLQNAIQAAFTNEAGRKEIRMLLEI